MEHTVPAQVRRPCPPPGTPLSLAPDKEEGGGPGKARSGTALPGIGLAFAGSRRLIFNVLSLRGDAMLAAPFLTLVLAFAPGSSTTSDHEIAFGIDVARKGLWSEARFRFEKAVALAPNNAEALNNLAIALEQQGAFEEARAAYEKALKLKPGNIYIQQNYDLFREADDKRNRKAKKKP
jgi:tetratricopeptide (TPR) repeat protein